MPNKISKIINYYFFKLRRNLNGYKVIYVPEKEIYII